MQITFSTNVFTGPLLSGNSFNDTDDEATFTTTGGGTFVWATHLTTETLTANGSGGWTGSLLESGTDTVASSGETTISAAYTATTGTGGESRKFSYYVRDAAGNDSNVITETFVVNSSLPTIGAELATVATTGTGTQYETTSFTGGGDFIVFWSGRTSGTGANALSNITVGTSGRGYGTGTALTLAVGAKNGRAESHIWYILGAPGGTVTCQFQSTDTVVAGEFTVLQVSGVTGIGATGTTTLTSNTAANSLTTTFANSLACALTTKSNGELPTSTDANTHWADTSLSVSGGILHSEDAATVGAYTLDSAWTTSEQYAEARFELLS